jgi:Leucine-rich repeat (LRR) protein
LQYISNYFQQAKSLKLYSDNYTEDTELIDITKFRNLIFIEFSKVNVNTVKGIQVLRSQLQKLVCQKTLNTLNDILNNCGADKSQASCWSELKEASFVSNSILELDQSLECAPWLHTLDLSHNEITNIEAVSCLGNLKTLNVSYNKLEAVPQFKGQICSRLQVIKLRANDRPDVDKGDSQVCHNEFICHFRKSAG